MFPAFVYVIIVYLLGSAWVNYVVVKYVQSNYIYVKFLAKVTDSCVAQLCDFNRRS